MSREGIAAAAARARSITSAAPGEASSPAKPPVPDPDPEMESREAKEGAPWLAAGIDGGEGDNGGAGEPAEGAGEEMRGCCSCEYWLWRAEEVAAPPLLPNRPRPPMLPSPVPTEPMLAPLPVRIRPRAPEREESPLLLLACAGGGAVGGWGRKGDCACADSGGCCVG